MNRTAVEQRAAEWLMRREEPEWSPAEQEALDRWLEESIAHKAAYWRLDHGWREADRIAALGSQPRSAGVAARRWWSRSFAAAAAIAAVVTAGSAILPYLPKSEPSALTAQTQIGERGTMKLGDGTKVELNTASRARASIGEKRRDVWLDEGEAYFEVAHDRSRPFTVHAGDATVTVLGTKFGVRRVGERVTVSVAEGRVQVESRSARNDAARATVIVAGDTAFSGDGALMLAPRSPERVEDELAWRQGVLRFDQETLANVAAEFNRYNRRKIVVTDPNVAAIRIGGTFHASNSDAFLRLLQDAYGLDVSRDAHEVKISD